MRKLFLAGCLLSAAQAADLSKAVIVSPNPGSKPVQVLREEILKRTWLELPVQSNAGLGDPAFVVEAPRNSGPRDGYRIRTEGSRVTVTGNDARGVLFGVGHLLRSLEMRRQRLELLLPLNVETGPATALRGHQLGYRPKTNSYDGWSLAQWDQYIRDLAIFGANAIELIPPRSDDDDDSPHFPASKVDTMVGMSRIADSYGLDVWIWYPAMDPDYSDAATVEFALKEWAEVFRKLPRIDAVFVPGGDPGHTRPKYLFALLEKQAASLRRFHPKAQMWMAPQGFTGEWFDEFTAIMKAEPKWLDGVVYGPQVRVTLDKLREVVPRRYPIRNYPDITHSLRAELPVPDWDYALAATLEREPINPRPRDEAHIFRLQNPPTIGFLTYSEGCNDDVNKFVWSALGWKPDADVESVLREFSRYFIGPDAAEDFARGLLALEENWRGPLASNTGVDRTLALFQRLERTASPPMLANWRFQQALYRAYYDAYERSRLLAENAAEQRGLALLRAGQLDAAQRAFDQPVDAAPDLRSRVFALAEALFQSIRMQLSAPKYAAQVGRGNNLDTLDARICNRPWLSAQVSRIRALGAGKQSAAVLELLEREDPGAGGFYDDLGDPRRRPHLDLGVQFARDPYYLQSPRIGFRAYADGPIQWSRFAETHFETPLRMNYSGLDPRARYRVRVVMSGENGAGDRKARIKLVANGKYVVHDYMEKPMPIRPVEFDVPAEATAGGTLTLEWFNPEGAGGAGRGCQFSEVWLLKVR